MEEETRGMYFIHKSYFVTKIVLVIEKIFEITRTIYSNSERPEQFLVAECFFNFFLEVSHMVMFWVREGAGLQALVLIP